MSNPLVVFVDIDDTLVRSVGAKRIPIPASVTHVRELFHQAVKLYAWSSGGGDYAKATAAELGIENCFVGFLPKPNVILDDQSPSEWSQAIWIHPNQAPGKKVEDYRSEISQGRK
jgi:hypothetical protein